MRNLAYAILMECVFQTLYINWTSDRAKAAHTPTWARDCWNFSLSYLAIANSRRAQS